MSGTNGFQATQVDASQQLRQRLNEPETAEALNDLIDNLPVVAFSVSAVDGFLRRGDTLEALASACNMDPARLRHSVERFNGFVRKGRDEDFHRGEPCSGDRW